MLDNPYTDSLIVNMLHLNFTFGVASAFLRYLTQLEKICTNILQLLIIHLYFMI